MENIIYTKVFSGNASMWKVWTYDKQYIYVCTETMNNSTSNLQICDQFLTDDKNIYLQCASLSTIFHLLIHK